LSGDESQGDEVAGIEAFVSRIFRLLADRPAAPRRARRWSKFAKVIVSSAARRHEGDRSLRPPTRDEPGNFNLSVW